MDKDATSPPADGNLALAIAEISNICIAVGVTEEMLPLEVERALIYHLRTFYDLGAMSTDKLVRDLRAQLEIARRETSFSKQETEARDQEIEMLRRVLYTTKVVP